MNPYSSKLVTLRGRNAHEGVLPAIPADLSITPTGWKPVIFNRFDGGNINLPLIPPININQKEMNINSNFTCKRVGLFCNFADGLVQKEVTPGIDVAVRAAAYIRGTPPSGGMTVSGDPTSKTMAVTAGAIADLTAGDFVLLTGGDNGVMPLGKRFREYGLIDSVDVPGGTFDLLDYPKMIYSHGLLLALTAISESAQFVFAADLSELNLMSEVDNYYTPNEFSTAGATDIIIIGSVIPNGTMLWLTDSINTAFSGATVFFDLVAEFEITLGPVT